MRLIWVAFVREAFKRPWQLVLTILSVASGVAVVVGVDIANTSALSEFERANKTIDGVATHRIVGGAHGLDESIFHLIKVDLSIRNAAPVVVSNVTIDGESDRYQLLGVDPISDFRVRGLSNGLQFESDSGDDPQEWPLFVIGSKASIDSDSRVVIRAGSKSQSFTLMATSADQSQRQNDGVENLLVTDISWAQSFLNMRGRLSQIELKLETTEQINQVKAALPDSVRLVDIALYNGAKRDMTQAFRVNLSALGLLALVIAMFLIYSSVSFQIVRRRRQIGLFRLSGVSSMQLVTVLLLESAAFAFLGVLVGLFLGYFLAVFLSALVTGTINALYFSLAKSSVLFTPLVAMKAGMLGIGATLLSSIVPILAVSRAPPARLVHGDRYNQALGRLSRWLFPMALVSFVFGCLLLLIPGTPLYIAFAGLFFLISAMALLTPVVIERICLLGRKVNIPGKGLLAKMVVLNVAAHQRRTSVAVAALSVAVSATLGVALMIDSFRFSVEQWLEGYLRSDIYITAESSVNGSLSKTFLNDLTLLSGVKSVATATRHSMATNKGPLTLFVLDTDVSGFVGFQIVEQHVEDLWRSFQKDESVLISEPYSKHNRLHAGNSVTIPTEQGSQEFLIAGVYRDYSSDRGLIAMSRSTYQRYFSDQKIVSAALVVDNDVDVEEVIGATQSLDSAPDGLFIRSNESLKERTLTIFDQTFRITEVLRWLAVFVSVVGIVSALMALQLERMREYAAMKAVGFSHWQLGGQILFETGVTGLIAGIMAVPIGLVLALSLIKVINLRSYGWSMQTVFAPELIIQSVFLAVAAALIAGLYPAWQLWRVNLSKGLRSE